ncbi:MAG: flagellar basal body rod protein FlgB [Gammaproteobacteria bacterium SHHR-1]|uniref:flagellar basal body rod protein FlgB n=1 Tax=Magnetovirga frankeli TaxID=947516 RepID=UPI001293B6F3|nr:flagellar basal body rod protein FlgB [gamma proteobacterium SS-5]
MNIDNFMGIHEQALRVRDYRSELLAANLANADTPGYKARDIDFKQILSQEAGQQQGLATTHQRHIPLSQGTVSTNQVGYRIPEQPSLDGNTVNTEREQVEFASNSLRYQASLEFVNGKIKGLLRSFKGQ